jgi:acyl carrier protein
MELDHETVKARYDAFVTTVCASRKIYMLQSEEGFANSTSNSYTGENDEPIELICFWSTEALAENCQADEWTEFEITDISLEEFIENACIGISNDDMMIGVDFDSNLIGYEVDPLELILDLLEEVKTKKLPLKLQNYKTPQDLINEIESVLGEE